MKYRISIAILNILLLLLSAHNAKSQITLTYDEFGIKAYPKKCIDTLVFKYVKSYPNCTLKLFLHDCSGAASFEVRSKSGLIKVKGQFDAGVDTLRKYIFGTVIGVTDGKTHISVVVIKHLYPLRSGTWLYYDSKGKVIRKEEYEYSFD